MDFANFTKLPKKTKLPEKFRLLEKRGFEPTEMRKIPASRTNPFHKMSMMPIVWNISIGQLGYLSGCAPSQLL